MKKLEILKFDIFYIFGKLRLCMRAYYPQGLQVKANKTNVNSTNIFSLFKQIITPNYNTNLRNTLVLRLK